MIQRCAPDIFPGKPSVTVPRLYFFQNSRIRVKTKLTEFYNCYEMETSDEKRITSLRFINRESQESNILLVRNIFPAFLCFFTFSQEEFFLFFIS